MFANNDLIVVFVGLLSAVALWLFSPAKSIKALSASGTRVAASAGQDDERDFAAALRRTSKKIVVFYGSQTGNALGSAAYAVRLAKEFKSRYGLSSLVCDPGNYDFNVLDRVPSDVLVVFVVSTYGEGEPTDNAIGLTEFLKTEELELSNGGNSLENLRYSIFALGNSTYEQFCKIGKDINNALTRAGATRLGSSGEGDEDKDLEEDYISWKEGIWPAVEKTMGWQVGAGLETADFELTECGPEFEQKRVYLGELSERALTGNRGVHDEKNPHVAPVSETRELFQSGERNCVFIDLDISDSGLRYQSGDHVGMWPMNPEVEVERLLRVLGLENKRSQIIDIVSLDPDLAKVPFPVPTNYETVFRHYIDISQLPSRQTIHSFSKFAPTENAKVMLDRFGSDKDFFHTMVIDKGLTLAQVLVLASGDSLEASPKLAAYTTWPIPFERIISRVPVLQPRYYSISSSPRLFPDSMHVTAVVSKTQLPASPKKHYGLHTNYLHSINLANSDSKPDPEAPVYRLDGPRGKYKTWTSYAIPIHTRPSKFRLPTSVKLPVIMVGPGTGIAPFRAFIQERVFLARRAKKAQGPDALKDWGHFHLFYGCRRAGSDFLFRDEWAEYAKELDGTFHMHVAFSREVGQPKVYVQDLIEQQSEVIAKAILEKQGYIYICGDAKYMAADVQAKLEGILAKAKGGGEDEGQKILKLLKEKKRLLLDVWS